MIQLITRLGNCTYRVPYLVLQFLAIDLMLVTAFMNEHIDHICCREPMIDLHKGSTIPVLPASDVFPSVERSIAATTKLRHLLSQTRRSMCIRKPQGSELAPFRTHIRSACLRVSGYHRCGKPPSK